MTLAYMSTNSAEARSGWSAVDICGVFSHGRGHSAQTYVMDNSESFYSLLTCIKTTYEVLQYDSFYVQMS
jgi:hypothetical protein